MPILLYCISNHTVRARDSLTGVADLPIVRIENGELVAFASIAPDPAVWFKQPLRTAVVEFHHVCNEIFKSHVIIPFRFPTIFETENELSEHLKERSGQYIPLLEEFGDFVQMEIHINFAKSPATADSGAAYLKQRLHASV